MRRTLVDPRGERGLLATEAAILMPVILLVALAAVYIGQVNRHSSRAQTAADAAARAASFYVSDAGEAEAAARSAAERVCRGPVALELDWTAPDASAFLPGRAVVRLSCSEEFSGFSPLVSEAERTEYGTAVATLEYWRPEP